jgi:hypothetical protein
MVISLGIGRLVAGRNAATWAAIDNLGWLQAFGCILRMAQCGAYHHRPNLRARERGQEESRHGKGLLWIT